MPGTDSPKTGTPPISVPPQFDAPSGARAGVSRIPVSGVLKTDLQGSAGRDEAELASRTALILEEWGRFYLWRDADFVGRRTVRRVGVETSLITAGPLTLGGLTTFATNPFGSLRPDASLAAEPPARLDRAQNPAGRRGVAVHAFDHRVGAAIYWDEAPGEVRVGTVRDWGRAAVLPPTPPKTSPRVLTHGQLGPRSAFSIGYLLGGAAAPPAEAEERWFPDESDVGQEGHYGIAALRAMFDGPRFFALLALSGSAGPEFMPGSVVAAATSLDLPIDRAVLTGLSGFLRGTAQLGQFQPLSGPPLREYVLAEASAEIEFLHALLLSAEYELELSPPTLPPGTGTRPGSAAAEALFHGPFSWEETAEFEVAYSRERGRQESERSLRARYTIDRTYTTPHGAFEQSARGAVSAEAGGPRLGGKLRAALAHGEHGWSSVDLSGKLSVPAGKLALLIDSEVVLYPRGSAAPEWGGAVAGRYTGERTVAELALERPVDQAADFGLAGLLVTAALSLEQPFGAGERSP